LRETALLELSKKREMYEDLALVLWGGFGGSLLLCGVLNGGGGMRTSDELDERHC
jgi:hypothetical protein